MTYTKSSAKHSAHGDFLRCFKSMFWFPLAAFLIHAGNYISTISNAFTYSRGYYQYILFDYEMYYTDTIGSIQFIMVIAGALTAFFAFSFIRKVPQYNIYLSSPVTRTTLFVNRTKVAAIYFAIASFVPTLLALLLNFILFKPNGYLVGICLMFGLAFFATAMIGYAVSAAISLAVGKAYEALLFTGVALFALPGIITNSISFFIGGLVNGGVGYNSSSVLSYFTKDYSQYNYWIKPYKFFINAEKFECLDRISKYPKLTIDVIGPVLLMLCIAMIILVLGAITFNNRKAENAGVVGANKPLVIGTGAVCAYAILYFCAYLIGGESTRIPAAIAGVVLSVVTYLLVTMLLYRNKKNIVKNFKVVGIVGGISTVIVVTFLTGVFGVYYTVPNVDKIDYAFAVASSSDGYITSTDYYSNNEIDGAYSHDTIVGKISDKQDLELLTSIHQSVCDQLDEGEGNFKVIYVMKNGNVKVRSYYHVGDEATRETLKLYDTKAYKEQVQTAYTTSDEEIRLQMTNFDDAIWTNEEEGDSLKYGLAVIASNQYTAYNQLDSYNYVFVANETQTDSIRITVNDAKELKKCIALDMAERTSEQICQNENNAIYYLCFGKMDYYCYYDDEYYYKQPGYSQISSYDYKTCVPIYADMQNAMAYIKDNDLSVNAFDVSDIKYAKCIDASTRFETEIFDYYSNIISYETKDNCFKTFSGKLSDYEPYKYNDSEEITKASELEELYEASHNQYTVIGDEGKIALFALNDGRFFTAYIPEDNIPSFMQNLDVI